jgi:hypothetical protein
MKSSEIKKGMRIVLANGWEGTMKDNMRGITRMAEIEGFYTETGSVYSYDIVAAQPLNDGNWTRIEYTEKELKTAWANSAFLEKVS